jgi:hypothetical protein
LIVTGLSFRRKPESSNIKGIPDAGMTEIRVLRVYQAMMASQKVAIYWVIVLSRALEILHVRLRNCQITTSCI